MKDKLKNKKVILKKISIFLSLMFICIVLYSIANYTSKQEFKSKNFFANDNSGDDDMDINSIKLESTLGKLTNTQRLEALKDEMTKKKGSAPTEEELTKEAIIRGIIVQQGLEIDIDALENLRTTSAMASYSDEEIVDKALEEGIIKQLGNTKINNTIDLNSLFDLKDTMEGQSDYDIVREAIKSKYITGSLDDRNLEINTNLDFTEVKLSAFGDYNENSSLTLKNILNQDENTLKNLYSKSLSQDLNVTGGNIKAEYNIDLATNPIPNSAEAINIKDIVIILDARMDSNLASQFLNGIKNQVFSNKKIIGETDQLNFIIIPYHNSTKRTLYYYKGLRNSNTDPRDVLEQDINHVTSEFSSSNISESSDEMNNALKSAKSWFTDQDIEHAKDNNTSGKSVIILSKEISEEELNKAEVKDNYNVISIFAGGVDARGNKLAYGQDLDIMSSAYSSSLNQLHYKIGGVRNTFHVSYMDSIYSGDVHNDIENPSFSLDGTKLSQKLAEDILNSDYNRSVTTKGTLHFNFGKDITICKDELDEDNEKAIDERIFKVELDDDGNQICTIQIPKIQLLTDYKILSSYNFGVSDRFIEDLLKNILDNTNQSNIKEEKVKLFLQDRLSDIDIAIDDDDIKQIIGNMYEEKLNVTVARLNTSGDYKNRFYSDNSGDKSILSKASYDKISGLTVKDILKNTDNYPTGKYGLLTDSLSQILSEGMDVNLNNALSDEICDKYDIKNKENKNDIIKSILGGTLVDDQTAKGKISTIIGKDSNSKAVADILNKIKVLFSSDTAVTKLDLRDTSVKALKDKGMYSESVKIKTVLAYSTNTDLDEVKEEIMFLLNQMLNAPLNLTQITYTVSGDGEKVEFTIEPTVQAAINEKKTKLEFKYNANPPDSDYNKNNNYIEHVSTLNSGSSALNGQVINSTPILNIKRILVSKDHVVYSQLQHSQDVGNDRFITLAKGVTAEEGLIFADHSVVTFASNITGMSSTKDITLTIDSKKNTDELALKTIGQNPRIYRIVYGDPNTYKDDKLVKYDDSKDDGKIIYRDGKIIYNLKDFPGDKYSDIIILYSVKIDGKGNYNNNVEVSGLSGGDGDIKIKVPDAITFPKEDDEVDDADDKSIINNLPDLY